MGADDCAIRGRVSPPPKKKDIWQFSVYLVLSLSCPNNSNVCTGFKILFICCLYIGPFWFLALLIGGKSKLCNYQQVNGAAEEADRQGRLRAGALSPGGRDTHQGMFAGHLAGVGPVVGTGARMENTVSELGLTVEHTAVLRVRWLYGRLGKGQGQPLGEHDI